MSVKYKLVLKKDLTKGAATDAKRYYASANVTGMMDFDTICDVVADRSVNADDFHASLIRKPRIIYSPGVKLREMIAKVSIERIGQETDKSDAGGEDDRPGEL